MPEHLTHFEGTAGALVLSDAILLYRTQTPCGSNSFGTSRPKSGAFASIHPVELDDAGQPTIGAGTPLSRARLRDWTEALERSVQPEILPANVLVAHRDMLAWWTPAQVRPAFFALSNPPANLRALSGRAVAPVPYPPHLFVATRTNLGVYALPASERPTADTPVLRSPILNVFSNGHLCWGNIPQPTALIVASIPDYEQAVFDSWSTHLNPGQERTLTGKGSLVRLWDDLAARRATDFPVQRLRPFADELQHQPFRGAKRGAPASKTVAQIIAESTQP
ncbi:PRTRC system protein B [Sphingobium sp. LB126]|uniref:PRTRC system protein B n=1 Tax=Sphingobium sp. LB126 TaxID=1983755 RepID=UPI000C205E37|nr:PRTRC system protein B [Sphingobium sp. LB126]PJG47240.1 PRTRC system protein B [Sphingobium sp. LB126]